MSPLAWKTCAGSSSSTTPDSTKEWLLATGSRMAARASAADVCSHRLLPCPQQGVERQVPATRYIGFCSEIKSFVGLKRVELDAAFCITPSLQPCPAGRLGWLPCPWRLLHSSSSQRETKNKATQLHTALHWMLSWPLS